MAARPRGLFASTAASARTRSPGAPAATVETFADGAGGADTYAVSHVPTTSIFDSGSSGSDTLAVGGTSGADEITVYGDLVFGQDPRQPVASYNQIETVAVDLGGGAD